MKDFILNNITIIDILDKYNIKHKGKLVTCPFHGKDKHPSAFAYQKHFHCFTCGEHLDTIGFVEKYFNLSFKEAMQKINEDFDLQLYSYTKIDYSKIRKIEQERKKKEVKENQNKQKFYELCNKKQKICNDINLLKNSITFKNWEDTVSKISKAQMQCEIIEMKLDTIDNILSSR